MINIKIDKLAPRQSTCCLCGETIKQDTLHVQSNFDESGHMSTLTRAHMYCADDFAVSFRSEVTLFWKNTPTMTFR